MGIPSYFRHLLSRYPKLLTGANTSYTSDHLLVDFNCLIYGCVPKLPPYRAEDRVKWESSLLEEIKSYVVKIWRTAGSPPSVFLAVDGVVPMAKIRQQRLRRFKSVWLAEKEREVGVAPDETWDKNAITPGTEFMEKLTISLKDLCKARGAGWKVSGAEEPGEGEQKLMTWVRGQKKGALDEKRITVYGLDADLILLCLLHATTHAIKSGWGVLRESQEFGKGVAHQEEFLVLSINGLLGTMFPDAENRAQNIIDYICGMSLLGNDFLPHSLGLTIKGAGHDRLVQALDELHRDSKRLVENGSIVPKSLATLLERWASTEAEDVCAAFKTKYSMRPQPPRSDKERAMLPVENLPLEWAEESRLWNKDSGLHDDWRSQYYIESEQQSFCSQTDIHKRCLEYFKGLQWVVNYYTGGAISAEWMYAWTYPPLWKDLHRVLTELPSLPTALDCPYSLKPQEQLALVLPTESWWLIRDPALKGIPAQMPYMWAKPRNFHSLGKRWLWECHPDIPIMTPARLRYQLATPR